MSFGREIMEDGGTIWYYYIQHDHSDVFKSGREHHMCVLSLSSRLCSVGAKERECIHGCLEGGENSGISVSAKKLEWGEGQRFCLIEEWWNVRERQSRWLGYADSWNGFGKSFWERHRPCVSWMEMRVVLVNKRGPKLNQRYRARVMTQLKMSPGDDWDPEHKVLQHS